VTSSFQNLLQVQKQKLDLKLPFPTARFTLRGDAKTGCEGKSGFIAARQSRLFAGHRETTAQG